jgi:hypothetical protein
MRRPGTTIAIALLAVGAVGGFTHGCRSMHKGDRHRRAAEICVDEALREVGHRHAGTSYVDGEHGPRDWEAQVRQLCADEARRQTGGRFAI